MIVVYTEEKDRDVGDVPCGLVVMSAEQYRLITQEKKILQVNNWLKSKGILGGWNSFGYSYLTVDGVEYGGLGFYVLGTP